MKVVATVTYHRNQFYANVDPAFAKSKQNLKDEPVVLLKDAQKAIEQAAQTKKSVYNAGSQTPVLFKPKEKK